MTYPNDRAHHAVFNSENFTISFSYSNITRIKQYLIRILLKISYFQKVKNIKISKV